MPGRKHTYTAREHRQVEHIKDSEIARGHSADEAENIAYATVTKHGGSKHQYTDKQKRQAEHIAESEEARGKSAAKAKSIGYATVNKRKKSR